MLVFVDESGDSGLKISQGSSRFFTIALVVFEDHDEAIACDQRITLLKRELSWVEGSEFHYVLFSEGFNNKSSFYKFACGLVFENAKDRLNSATIVIDESGNLEFKKQLATYLRRRLNDASYRVGKVKMQRSESNNLLQLADYIASIVNRSVTNQKRNADTFRHFVAHREIRVQVWPTENPDPIPLKGTRR